MPGCSLCPLKVSRVLTKDLNWFCFRLGLLIVPPQKKKKAGWKFQTGIIRDWLPPFFVFEVGGGIGCLNTFSS